MAEQTFGDWVRTHPKVEARQLARKAIKLKHPGVVDVLAEEIDHIRRGVVQAQEIASLRALLELAPLTAHGGRAAPAPEILSFLRERFALGDGTFITWGAATIEQHEQRVALLRGQIAGLSATMARHVATIARLRDTGARCLDALVRSGRHAAVTILPAREA
jgi:hypothetical protein